MKEILVNNFKMYKKKLWYLLSIKRSEGTKHPLLPNTICKYRAVSVDTHYSVHGNISGCQSVIRTNSVGLWWCHAQARSFKYICDRKSIYTKIRTVKILRIISCTEWKAQMNSWGWKRALKNVDSKYPNQSIVFHSRAFILSINIHSRDSILFIDAYVSLLFVIFIKFRSKKILKLIERHKQNCRKEENGDRC